MTKPQIDIFTYLDGVEWYYSLLDNALKPDRPQANTIWYFMMKNLTQEIIEQDGEATEEEIEDDLNDYNLVATRLCDAGYRCPVEFSEDEYEILKHYV